MQNMSVTVYTENGGDTPEAHHFGNLIEPMYVLSRHKILLVTFSCDLPENLAPWGIETFSDGVEVVHCGTAVSISAETVGHVRLAVDRILPKLHAAALGAHNTKYPPVNLDL